MNVNEKLEVLQAEFRELQKAVSEKLNSLDVSLRKLTWRFHEQFPHYGLEQRLFELEESLFDQGVLKSSNKDDFDGRPDADQLYERYQIQKLREELAMKEAELDQLRAKLDDLGPQSSL